MASDSIFIREHLFPERFSDALKPAVDRCAFSDAGRRASVAAARVISRATAPGISLGAMSYFLHAWHAMHLSAEQVAALIVRLLTDGQVTSAKLKSQRIDAATRFARVIEDDLGLSGVAHARLFERFAHALVGDAPWRDNRYAIAECDRYRSLLVNMRARSPLNEAAACTVTMELWNAAEFSYFGRRLSDLKKARGLSDADVSYIAVHSFELEGTHAIEAAEGWRDCCAVDGIEANPSALEHTMTSIFVALGDAYEALDAALASCRAQS